MSPIPLQRLAARGSQSSEDAAKLSGNPAIAAVLITISVAILAATLLILYRLWRSHSNGRSMRASLEEFDMSVMTRRIYGSRIDNFGVTPLSGVMLTQVEEVNQSGDSTRAIKEPFNLESRRPSVIDVSTAAVLRLGLARQSTPPFFNVAVSSDHGIMQSNSASQLRATVPHYRATNIDSMAPSNAGTAEKLLPNPPSPIGHLSRPQIQRLTQTFSQPGPLSPGGPSFTSSSSSHSRSKSEDSLFSFVQHRTSSLRGENHETMRSSPIHIPATATVGYVGHPPSDRAVAGNGMRNENPLSTYINDSTNLLIHSDGDNMQAPQPPWFDRIARTSREQQTTHNVRSRPSCHLPDTSISETLLSSRRFSCHDPSRRISIATTFTTPPPPPYTPLDTYFEVPPLPQKAQLASSSQRRSHTTPSMPNNPALDLPLRRHAPALSSDSKDSLRSLLHQRQASRSDQGPVLCSRPRSNSLPIQKLSLSRGSLVTNGQSRHDAPRPVELNTRNSGKTGGRAWVPGRIDAIVSATPTRGTFTIDE